MGVEQGTCPVSYTHLPQLIAYTCAKLVFVAQKVNKQINYRLIWDLQEVPSCIDEDIAAISKIAFDVMYDENRPTANIESYCKREECWTNVAKQNYTISEDGYGAVSYTHLAVYKRQ